MIDLSREDVESCIRVLQALSSNPESYALLSDAQRRSLMEYAGMLSRPERDEKRKRQRSMRKARAQEIDTENRKARAVTGIRSARVAEVFAAPEQIAHQGSADTEEKTLNSPANCYVCKAAYTRLHFFYDAMCPECAALNYAKRFQRADLTGQTALITGSRLKIGYQSALMMLRAGATVIASTRFPVDAARRFSAEKDFNQWGQRLEIYGLDLRHTPSVELFCTYIEQRYERLDILVNNAAQTVRRPPGFYAHLMDYESIPFEQLDEKCRTLLGGHRECIERLGSFSGRKEQADLPLSWEGRSPGLGLIASAQLSQIPYAYDHAPDTKAVFPTGKLDADLQQVDLRTTNSWRLRLGEIHTGEMLEIQLVNAVAPFVLCNRLSHMMKRDYTGKKHIVNVSAMEGKFFRFSKDPRHPHTNMAKAALNMLTHSSAAELAKHGIYMNAVDTGWVTDEDPAHLAEFKQKVHDFQPPLDIVDGAARVCDPFFDGINTGRHWCGKFLKDYFPIDW